MHGSFSKTNLSASGSKSGCSVDPQDVHIILKSTVAKIRTEKSHLGAML